MIFASEKIRQEHGLPEGWRAYRLAVLGTNGSHVQMDGGVYPETYSKGPRKGSPDYRKPLPGSERTVIISMLDYDDLVGRPHHPQTA